MDAPTLTLEEAIRAVDRLISGLKKNKTAQVRSAEERQTIKANALAWFHSHKPQLTTRLEATAFLDVDQICTSLLELSERSTTRSKYQDLLRSLKTELVSIRSKIVATGQVPAASNKQPDFSKLISASDMRSILERRWDEAQVCLGSGADLSATIMMGSLLEALLLARINVLPNAAPIFKLKSTPQDKKTGKAKPLTEWTLKDFIEVAHEMKWIRDAAKKVGVVLRDYRNFVHPERELSIGISIDHNDAKMFWAVFNELAVQIIESVP